MKNVLFVVEANNRIGIGHVSRCIELARMLRTHQVTPYFLINNNQNLKEILAKNNFYFYIKPKNEKIVTSVKDLAKIINLNCIIIDLRKKITSETLKKLKKNYKIVTIVNYISKAIFDSDLIIFPEIKEQYDEKILQSKTRKLIGAKYAILNTYQYKKQKNNHKVDILISMGGSDKRNLSQKLIREFKKHQRRFKIKIVIGKFFNNTKKILKSVEKDNRFSVIQNETSLMPYMKNSKIGIFTFGITAYEALSVGLPSIIIAHSKENDLAAKKMFKYNCIHYLGYYNSINVKTIPKISFSLLDDWSELSRLSKQGEKVVDGKGSFRVTKEILKMI